ncbi:hypothetical protein SCH01S_33_00190 [Sphingomonas changbaiensis NBRC 104936]|uniref:Uncharacterized protein n=2 Tax=Sphingomonas changbaiensis TaxID=529705 RepID=A0A0E9MP45_9SPHN|nr:hypothetical protein SCH01S_33_00190 [Sphingomonas changbaiensis NBRC 104936]
MGDLQPHSLALFAIRRLQTAAPTHVGMSTVWILTQAAEISQRRLTHCAVRVRKFSAEQFATLPQPGGEAFLGPCGRGRVGYDPDVVECGSARERPVMRFLDAA